MAYTSYSIRSGATISANVKWTDIANRDAPVAGETVWTSSDEAIATVTVDSADTTMARITSCPAP